MDNDPEFMPEDECDDDNDDDNNDDEVFYPSEVCIYNFYFCSYYYVNARVDKVPHSKLGLVLRYYMLSPKLYMI